MRRRGDIFTLELFDDESSANPYSLHEPPDGSLACSAEVRSLITRIIKDSPHDRFEIAARMSRYLGASISKTTLDTWTADSKHQHRFPFEYAAAFEYATESYALTDWLAKKRSGEFVVGDEVLLAELGRIEGAKAELKRYETRLKQKIEGKHK